MLDSIVCAFHCSENVSNIEMYRGKALSSTIHLIATSGHTLKPSLLNSIKTRSFGNVSKSVVCVNV